MRRFILREIFTGAAFILAVPLIVSAQDPPKPLAIVGGEPIYEKDLMSVAGPSLLDLSKKEFQAKSDALNKLIAKKILEAEAKKRGLSAEDLLKQEVDSKVAEPSDDEARGYYLAVKGQTTLPFEQVKAQIKQLLKNSEIQQAREKYVNSLRDKVEVSILLQPPVVHVDIDPARVKGDPQAPVTIVEFADFQCPFCGRVQPTLKTVLEKYKGKVKLAYRDFPLSEIHPFAEIAAEGSRCALEQGKYWEMHDAMFGDQSKLTEADLIKTASGLGMNQQAFETCLKSGKYKAAVAQDHQAGSQAGVNGTPSFFINGEFLSGSKSAEEFDQVIDRELASAGGKSSERAAR